MFIREGEFEDAKEHWTEAIELDPKQSDVYVNLGNLEMLVHKNSSEAISCYKKAIEYGAHDGEIYYNLAVASDLAEQVFREWYQ